MLKIVNLRSCRPVFEYDVRIDRSSVLGNPFFMSGESKRDEVCDKYDAWFKNNLGREDVKNEINRLIDIYEKHGKLRLFCWCAPLRCHGITIAQHVAGASSV